MLILQCSRFSKLLTQICVRVSEFDSYHRINFQQISTNTRTYSSVSFKSVFHEMQQNFCESFNYYTIVCRVYMNACTNISKGDTTHKILYRRRIYHTGIYQKPGSATTGLQLVVTQLIHFHYIPINVQNFRTKISVPSTGK